MVMSKITQNKNYKQYWNIKKLEIMNCSFKKYASPTYIVFHFCVQITTLQTSTMYTY